MTHGKIIFRALVFSLLLSVCALPAAQGLRASRVIGAVVQGSHYDPVKGIVTVSVLNTSQKDITAIDFNIILTYPDGTAGSHGWSTDFLGGMISTIEQGHEIEPGAGNGTFEAGALRDFEIPQTTPITDIRATVGVVIYADGMADVLNETAFRQIVLQRKGRVLAMQKADELLANALADPKNDHPSATVAAQLEGLANVLANNKNLTDDPTSYEGLGFLVIAQDLRNAPKDPTGRSAQEENYLRALIKTHESRISLILPQTELTKEGQR
ncbi:MAG: hypothetical protein WCD43_06490 [Candidatus Acidiferrales bacterium]